MVSKLEVSKGWLRTGNDCLMSMELPFGVMKMSWNYIWVMNAYHCEYTKHRLIAHFKMVKFMSEYEFYLNFLKNQNRAKGRRIWQFHLPQLVLYVTLHSILLQSTQLQRSKKDSLQATGKEGSSILKIMRLCPVSPRKDTVIHWTDTTPVHDERVSDVCCPQGECKFSLLPCAFNVHNHIDDSYNPIRRSEALQPKRLIQIYI